MREAVAPLLADPTARGLTMRLATLVDGTASLVAAVVDGDRALPLQLDDGSRPGVRALAGDRGRCSSGSAPGRPRSPPTTGSRSPSCTLGPAIPDPGAIYTIGLNYRAPGEPPGSGPDRPLVYGKAASSVAGDGATLAWDRVAHRQRRRGVRARHRHRPRRRPTSRPPTPCATSSAGPSSTTSRRATSGSTATSGSSASRCRGSARSGHGSSPPTSSTPPTSASAARSTARRSRTTGRRRCGSAIAEIVSYLSRHLVLRPGDLIASGHAGAARLAARP